MAAASALSFAVATSALRASSAQQNPCASFPCPSSTLQLRSNQRLASLRPPRCQPEGKSEQQPTQVPVSPAVAPPPPAAPKAPRPAASTGLWDALAFGGPAPERINGRLAMVGFVSALAVELARGDDLLAQLASGGLPWFAGTAALLSVASLVPMLKGVTAQSKSGGLMTSDAEMWNGRFAMLGLLALAFTEYLKGGPLV